MRNTPPPDGFSEQTRSTPHRIEPKHYTANTSADQMMLDYLLESGFLWEEAVILLNLREHLYENAEMRQRVSDDYRMHFVKWLYEHGVVSDN